jgi:hypothetical protein
MTTSSARAEDDMARRTVSGSLTPQQRAARKARLRVVQPDDPYGLAGRSAKDLAAELKRRQGDTNAAGKPKQYRETPKLIKAIIRMATAAGKRVGPGMDIAALDQLANLRDEVERITGEAARELTRANRPHVHGPDEPCIRDGETPCGGDSPTRVRYSWTDVANALGFKDRQTAWCRYADPSGRKKR